MLRELGTPTHVGDNGHGLVLKLAINISLAVQMLAFSEGLPLAERDGVDIKLAVDVITSSPLGSPMLKRARRLVLDLPDEAWFDIGLITRTSRSRRYDTARQVHRSTAVRRQRPTRCWRVRGVALTSATSRSALRGCSTSIAGNASRTSVPGHMSGRTSQARFGPIGTVPTDSSRRCFSL